MGPWHIPGLNEVQMRGMMHGVSCITAIEDLGLDELVAQLKDPQDGAAGFALRLVHVAQQHRQRHRYSQTDMDTETETEAEIHRGTRQKQTQTDTP